MVGLLESSLSPMLSYTYMTSLGIPLVTCVTDPSAFPRTESVAEKMLTNWFAFLLHKFLKVRGMTRARANHTP